MHTHRCGNNHKQKCLAQGREKEAKRRDFMYRDTTGNLKFKIIPDTGILAKVLWKNLDAIPGKHSTDSLQKTATLRTSHIIHKVQQSEP